MFYEKYLNSKGIKRRKEQFGFPNTRFIELLIYDYEVFRHLLQISNSFYLKGGAAAQLYMEPSEQRASKDIDLITDHSPEEITEIFTKINDIFPSRKHIPAKVLHDIPMVTYLVEADSVVETGEKISIKVDILFEDLSNYRLSKAQPSEIFALNTEVVLPMISLGSLVADKFLTLAQKSIGLPKDKLSEYPKQIYDLARITQKMNQKEFSNMVYSFERIIQTELKIRHLENTTKDVILHICDVLEQFAALDQPKNNFKDYINDFQSAYVGEKARKTNSGWILDSLTLLYLLRMLRKVIIEGKKEEDAYSEWNSFKEERYNLAKLSIDEKKKLREELLNKLREMRHPQWKRYKSSSEERLFLEIKVLEEKV